MTHSTVSDYFRQRERQERSLARMAEDSAIAAIHLNMADRYAAMTGPSPTGETRHDAVEATDRINGRAALI